MPMMRGFHRIAQALVESHCHLVTGQQLQLILTQPRLN